MRRPPRSSVPILSLLLLTVFLGGGGRVLGGLPPGALLQVQLGDLLGPAGGREQRLHALDGHAHGWRGDLRSRGGLSIEQADDVRQKAPDGLGRRVGVAEPRDDYRQRLVQEHGQ